MTYEELLSIMDNYTFKDSSEPVKALRAVVEMHSICEVSYGGELTIAVLCDWCRVDYPCKTIEVIEKELA